MTDEDWQCGDCGTLVEASETRQCPICGGINFYPLADEVPGEDGGTVHVAVDVERALAHLSEDANSEP